MPAFFTRKKQLLLLALLLIGSLSAYGLWQYRQDTVNEAEHQPLEPVRATGPTRGSYDVIVVGTDPEGVSAAVSAARNGLKVLLVDGRNREILGGLMTLGWLNSLDNNYSPVQQPLKGKHDFLNKGLFQEWYDQIEGTSFDINTAANVFNRMVSHEKNIDLMLKARKMEPDLQGERVTGLRIAKEDGTVITIGAKVLIDATQDADIAAAAGAPYTFGREDIGEPDARMAVTLVFKMSGVTQNIWDSFAKHPKSGIDKMSAWGFGETNDYVSSNPKRVKMRSLNIGRQNDGTILINSMQIYGINPVDPASVQEALEIGRKEAPRVAEYLKKTYGEFRDLQYAGTAPELYVRESRHIEGEYRLKMTDLMENRDQWDAIAYGSYEVDIQSLTPDDRGFVMMKPKQYGVPFRCLVPKKIDGLLVVGRSASFDSLPHGSARVIPLGMAAGQAAGAAAKLAIEKNVSFREMSRSRSAIAELRDLLLKQGMELKMLDFPNPKYADHKDYPGLLAAVSMAMTSGDKTNDKFDLDRPSNKLSFANKMMAIKRIHPVLFPGDPYEALAGVTVVGQKDPISLDQAADMIALSVGLPAKPGTAYEEIVRKGWIRSSTLKTIADPDSLSNGDVFMLIRDLAEYYAGVKYE